MTCPSCDQNTHLLEEKLKKCEAMLESYRQAFARAASFAANGAILMRTQADRLADLERNFKANAEPPALTMELKTVELPRFPYEFEKCPHGVFPAVNCHFCFK